MEKNGDSWCTAECMGIHTVNRPTRFEALESIRLGVRAWPDRYFVPRGMTVTPVEKTNRLPQPGLGDRHGFHGDLVGPGKDQGSHRMVETDVPESIRRCAPRPTQMGNLN